MSEQKAQDGLVTAAWLGARRVEGVAGGRHEASDRGRERKSHGKWFLRNRGYTLVASELGHAHYKRQG